MSRALRDYALVTAAYWGFTLSDGALRMLVLLHFYRLGYTPVQLAFLFLFYELAGVVTNLAGGYLAARRGLKATLTDGLALQVFALLLLSALGTGWPRAVSVAWVMGAQALSGIAKDLTKLSAKSSIKLLVPEGAQTSLFRWVALLTGSKNALKGAGFFLGGLLLAGLGFRGALWAMAGALLLVLALSAAALPGQPGRAKERPGFSGLFAKSRAINVLSAARLFLFGARDVWFVVGVPVFLSTLPGWGFTRVGAFLALWVIGYGLVQSVAPQLLSRFTGGRAPQGRAALVLAFALAATIAAIPVALLLGARPAPVIFSGLAAYGVVFAINSSLHSYLILAYSDGDKVALNVGFYYMANAGGRLLGTLLSGLGYQLWGLSGCLWISAGFSIAAGLISIRLPAGAPALPMRPAATSRTAA